ncbi:MAG: DNA mismatch repair protein MutS [Lentisphaeria bacterium]|nr:DNA mismatch repair protein MutS [Lentisphaeria bacterium]
MADGKLTPMMQQYRAAKSEIPADAILLFRLGDFYEMFFEDAVKASAIMELTLTKRQGYPMCGFPWHALDAQLPRLLNAGVKVAIAEQLEDPKLAKGIVKRAITRIITPGTVIDSSVLKPQMSNFLAALNWEKKRCALAALDISTGEFNVTEFDCISTLESELARLDTHECLIPGNVMEKWQLEGKLPAMRGKIMFTEVDEWIFAREFAREALLKHFNVLSLDGFGGRELTAGIGAAAAVLHYAAENLRQEIGHINRLKVGKVGNFMELDVISQRNLELVDPMYGTDKSVTLLGALDKTSTPMGSRLLREWILRPLYDKNEIDLRLDAVEVLRDDPMALSETVETLGVVRDLERITGRLNLGSANARDLAALATSLSILPGLKALLEEFDAAMIREIENQIVPLPELVDEISRALNEELPLTITDGGIIRCGYHAGLDELRSAASEGKGWLANIQAREQERTGIKSLKVKYNSVFGYYIEVSKSNLSLVPEDYVRKQTLVNAERFITPELKELESKILGAEEKSKALELEIFQQLRAMALQHTMEIQNTARVIAVLDVLSSLAECARERRYVRPEISEDDQLVIKGGRHPVLELNLSSESFVPNDCLLDGNCNRMMLITGPNMAGKSTYIRQTALLTIMAQIGSFIPAESAHVGLVDRIFTRVGAADDLARGQSTFMVEMVETANILNYATRRSLVILDEIGRGTSTFDGLSIAWAVAEYLHDDRRCQCRTQFATHYHELTQLAEEKRGVNNYNIAVREYGDKIIFLRQIVPGATDRSYGIHVAQLAGLPKDVIKRAGEILTDLENSSGNPRNNPLPGSSNLNEIANRQRVRKMPPAAKKEDDDTFQMRLF